HGGNLLNEHYLVIYFSIVIFDSLAKEDFSGYQISNEVVNDFLDFFKTLLAKSGYENEYFFNKANSIKEAFELMHKICSEIQTDFVISYLSKLLCGNQGLSYLGPLCLYQNFLLPILKKIKEFQFLPN